MIWDEQAEMEALATSVRKVARLLWALHLSFLDGFDEVRPPQTKRPVAPVMVRVVQRLASPMTAACSLSVVD